MCGRYTLASLREFVHSLDWLKLPEDELEPRYNIAPSQDVPAVTNDSDTLQLLHWGLVPSWAKDVKIGYKMINARAETLETSNAFKRAFAQRRCLVPADGFYEWQAQDKGPKQPYLFRRADGRPFAFAGLWESWRDDAGHTLHSCTVITTRPNELVADVHDRMPVILHERDYACWLGRRGEVHADDLKALLRPFPANEMRRHPVSRSVNRPGQDDSSLVERVEPDERSGKTDQPTLF